MKKRIRTQGMLILFAAIMTIVLSSSIFPKWNNEDTDKYLNLIGIGMVLFGFLFRISARGYKEEKSLSGKKLVKDGPYALMRNPMYFGTLLIGTGFVITLVEWWALLVFLFVFFLIYIPQIKREEVILLKKFGEEYKNYCAETPKYFPRIAYLLNIKKYITLKLSWIKKELIPLITAIAALFAIEIAADARLFSKKELFNESLELVLSTILFILIISLFFKPKGK